MKRRVPPRGAESGPHEPAFADAALARAPFGISLVSARPESFGAYLFANPAYCAITGYSLEQLMARSFRDIVHPDDLPRVLDDIRRLLAREIAEIDSAIRMRRGDGAYIAVRQHRTVVFENEGAPLWIVSHSEDVTELQEQQATVAQAHRVAQEALRESESRYRLIADYSPDMIVRTRRDRTRLYVSPGSKRLLGYAPAELSGMDFSQLIHPDDRERVESEFAQFIEGIGTESHTYRVKGKDAAYIWVEARWVSAPLSDDAEAEDGVVAIVRDISEQKAAESKIASMARHDVLTGLANRVLLRERLDETQAFVEGGGSAALFLVDLDNFKGVNDTLGHDAGDALLQAVAERLLTCVRQTDTVARLGGDEFTVVLRGMDDTQEAVRRAQRIVDVLSERYDLAGGHQVLIGASVGVTTSPADGIFPEQLLKNADAALYAAKAAGRRTFRLFQPDMAVRRQARLDTETELRVALAAGEFVIFYQPIVSAASEAVVGFEALLRWQHPVHGTVFPDEFIPVAEDTGIIVPLGEWVLRAACRDAARWPASIRVSVNVSAVQFERAEFVETVRSALAESGLPAGRLDLEITESVLLKRHRGTLLVLNELRQLGVSISLDDFGTGYSSLGQLRSFRFDRMKIDRSFIGDLLRRPESRAIVRAVIGMAGELGILTVAEGVETRAQFQRLRAFGCSEAQGFLFSEARPAEDVAEMLAIAGELSSRALSVSA